MIDFDWDAFEERVCQNVEARVFEKLHSAFLPMVDRLNETPEITLCRRGAWRSSAVATGLPKDFEGRIEEAKPAGI